MFESLFGPKSCKLHGQFLQRDHLAVQYGLMKFGDGYLKAKTAQFSHAHKIAYGGCLLGPPCHREVMYCAACREAESRWHDENPDFNEPSAVLNAVILDRRALPASLATRRQLGDHAEAK